MEITVTQRRENALLDRTEVYFTVAHPTEGTPNRADLRKALSGALNVKGVVVLDWARSEFGRTATRGYAKVYKSKEHAVALEPRPILIRNGLAEKAAKKEEAAPKEAPPPRREEKKEAPKAEAPKKEEAAPKEEPKKDASKPAAKEKAPAKKEEAPKEKKPAAKKEAK